MIQDTVAAWRLVDHMQGVEGHKRTGLNNALDGSEDTFITREALEFWNELDLWKERLKAIAEVDAAIAEGNISFSNWPDFVVHPDTIGHQPEGAELEGVLCPGEKSWEPDVDEETNKNCGS